MIRGAPLRLHLCDRTFATALSERHPKAVTSPSTQPPVPTTQQLRRRSAAALSRNAQEALRYSRAFAAAGSLTDRTEAFSALMRWIWSASTDAAFSGRLHRWMAVLEGDEPLRQSFQRSVAEMLEQLHSVGLFAEAGLPSQHALFQEGVRRVLQRMLPSVRAESDTTRLLVSIFPSSREVERFIHLPPAEYERLAQLLLPPERRDAAGVNFRGDLTESLRLLGARISGRGVKTAVRERGSGQPLAQSPFYRLSLATEALLQSLGTPDEEARLSAWKVVVSNSCVEIDQVHLHMETAGVSSDLVFDIKSIDLALKRMCALVEALTAKGDPEKGDPQKGDSETSDSVRRLLDRVIVGQLHDTKLSSLLRQNMNLLARKTVERTGRGGEHYIAHSRKEYWWMWRASLGGGLLTVLTAAIKMRIAGSHFPPFVEGLLSGTNYAISFILLQVFGLVLATKQPSMTAATFAGIVRRNRGEARWSKIADFVAAITRSQLAAAIGNILAVVIGSIALERLWQLLFRSSYLPISSARHVYETLHPFTSGTAIFAIVTGIILWLAALIGGWFENFAIYHRLTEAIRQHPFGGRFGEKRLAQLADVLERDMAGWSTSIALGYLLGFTPVVSGFFGIHLDVRHVTLTTGTLALAAARFGTGWFGRDWLYWAIAGIGVTFVLNLGVSFSIAAYVALRAYDVPREEQKQLVSFILKQAIRTPFKFLLPVGHTSEEASRATAEMVEEH